VLGHCTAVWTAKLHRCIGSDTILLANFVAQQH